MRRFSLAASGAILIASPACAEVADKEAPLSMTWALTLAFVVIAFVLEKLRPRLGLIVVPVAAFVAWETHSELSDPSVGPAIITELGRNYVWSTYASVAAGVLGPIVVVSLSILRGRRRSR